jgi:hypothetical protein
VPLSTTVGGRGRAGQGKGRTEGGGSRERRWEKVRRRKERFVEQKLTFKRGIGVHKSKRSRNSDAGQVLRLVPGCKIS